MIKLINIEPGKFMELLDKAKGEVYLVTDEGDKINMKSKLCQLYGLKILLGAIQDGKISASLECSETEDTTMFVDYLFSGKTEE